MFQFLRRRVNPFDKAKEVISQDDRDIDHLSVESIAQTNGLRPELLMQIIAATAAYSIIETVKSEKPLDFRLGDKNLDFPEDLRAFARNFPNRFHEAFSITDYASEDANVEITIHDYDSEKHVDFQLICRLAKTHSMRKFKADASFLAGITYLRLLCGASNKPIPEPFAEICSILFR